MSARELRAKTRQRNGLVTQCGDEIKKAQPLLTQPLQSRPQIEAVYKLLKLNLAELKALNEFILETVSDEQFDAEADTSEANSRNLTKAIVQIEVAIEQDDRDKASAAAATAQAALQSTVASQPTQDRIRLPKLEIDKYDGDPLKYQEFWDHFSSTIHCNPQLQSIDKFKYLKCYLEGEALNVASGYAVIEANYQTVVDALQKRFGNRQLAIFIHFTKLLNMDSVKGNDPTELQVFFDDFECHVRSLVNLKLEESTVGQVFAPILLNKLPSQVQMELHRRLGEDVWDLDKLRSALHDEVRLRKMSHWNFNESSGPGTNSSDSYNGLQSTASMLPANSVTVRRPIYCSFCGESHPSESCTAFPTAESRKQQVTGRCVNCLRNNHSQPNCRHSRNCRHCQQRHHSSLCDIEYPSQPQQGYKGYSDGGNCVQANAMSSDSALSSSIVATSNVRCTHMQTALCEIWEPVRQSHATGRILFDTGGSRSYITRSLANKLGLAAIGREVISIAGFEETVRRTQTHDVVEFDVPLYPSGFQRVYAFVADSITCPVAKQPININSYTNIPIPMAEPLVNDISKLPIDILIGNDFYYCFMHGQHYQFADGMVFVSSKLGFLTAGASQAIQSNQPQNCATRVIIYQSTRC